MDGQPSAPLPHIAALIPRHIRQLLDRTALFQAVLYGNQWEAPEQ